MRFAASLTFYLPHSLPRTMERLAHAFAYHKPASVERIVASKSAFHNYRLPCFNAMKERTIRIMAVPTCGAYSCGGMADSQTLPKKVVMKQ